MSNTEKNNNIIRQGIQGALYVWRQEFKQVLKDQGVLIFFILVPLAYPILYAFIYDKEVVREVPTVMVDHCNSSISREYTRRVDATPDVKVVGHCADMIEAQNVMKDRKAYGIIYIPNDFNKNISTGKQARVSLYCDMSGLLYYKAIVIANTSVSLDMNKEIKVARAGNTTNRQDEIMTYPVEYEDVALFNPTTGFATFLLPAVLMLIIQQTLLLGVGLSAGTSRERNRFRDLIPMNKHYQGTLRVVFGKSLAYFVVYVTVSAYVLLAVPKMFSLVQIGSVLDIAVMMLPYLLSCIFFSMTASVAIRNRENCILLFVFTSVPLLFLSGISWPSSAIPDFWRYFSYIFPSTFGINAFVKINNMAADISQISFEYKAMWIQAGVYFITTFLVYRRQIVVAKGNLLNKYKEMRKGK